jgi:hypothetical protein
MVHALEVLCFTFILRFLQLTHPFLDFLCDRRPKGILTGKKLQNKFTAG